MKKLILFGALVLLVFATVGCDKNKEENILKDDATIIYEGNPALDGCGYFVKIKNTSLLLFYKISRLKI